MNREYTPQKPIYIYTLSCPKTGEPRYIGVTNNPQRRLTEHIREAKNGIHNHRTHWISSLLSEGLKPVMKEIDETDNENWQQCEIAWIAHYRTMGYELVNGTDGGEGQRGCVPSEETRKKLSQSLSGENNPNYGKRLSDEIRHRMAESKKNMSDETRRRMSESQKIRASSDENFHKLHEGNKKPIYQYDKLGHFIRQWDSASDASRALSLDTSTIYACCKHKAKSAGGFIWRYTDDPLLLEQPRLF